MNLAKYYTRFLGNGWMINPQAFTAMLATLIHLRRDEEQAEHPLVRFSPNSAWGQPPAQAPAQQAPYSLDAAGVATIPIHGTMVMRPDAYEKKYLGMTCVEEISNAIQRAVNDPKVRALMLDFDSPGGSVTGTPELAALVADSSAVKPFVSYTDSLQCSAAYWVGSQCSAVLASPSASIGNVGCYMTFLDISKLLDDMGAKVEVINNDDSPLKGMGVFGTALNDGHKAFLQQSVNDTANAFKQDVSEKRGCSGEAMNGGWYSGCRAMKLKLADQLCDRRAAMKTAAQLAA
jgi:signal peptide peptidase SppA